MKKKVFAILMVVVMMLGVVGCGSNGNNPGKNDGDTNKPAKEFSQWNDEDIMQYFKDEKVFTNDDLCSIQKGENAAENVTSSVCYMDNVTSDEYVEIIYFDPNTTSDKVKEGFEEVKTTKVLSMDEGQMVFNTLVGNFAIFYSSSLDEQFIADFEAAYDKLLKTYSLTPEFYDKEIDFSQYEE
jgi:hypothetical protein